jgi:hypothetical protein
MMMCDCDDDDDDATGDDRVAETGSNGTTGDVDSISGEGFLRRFFDVGSEVGAGAGAGVVGVGWREAVAETGESASGD